MDLSKLSFKDYKDNCVAELMPLQDEFMKLYDINSYEEWFYDHDIGAFHFKSHNGKNLYFKYVDVGSFSTNTSTWKWSWGNETTPASVSKSLEKVKAFGQANHYEPLTRGLIDGDEYTGWEMTAIAVKMLNAFGAYRVPSDHLFIYFIFTNALTSDEYEALKDKVLACDTHGNRKTAFICQHLTKSSFLGFHEAFETDPEIEPENDYQAWCDACEKERLKEGEWNDTSMAFADIKIVCDLCYFEIKKRNQKSNQRKFARIWKYFIR